MNTINERISECIKKSGLTKTAFGKRIGVSQSFVSQICSGASSPSSGTIKNICREFNISEDWLLTGEGEPFLPQSKEDVLRNTVEHLMPDESADFKRRLVVALSQLKPEQWDALEAVALELMKNPAAPAYAPTHIPTIEGDARAETAKVAKPGEHPLTIDEQVELYRQQLLLEEEQAKQASSAKESDAV